MKLVCENCNCSFERPKRRKFCSGDCYHTWSRGRINKRPKTPDHRMKLSESQKGKSHTSDAFLSPERGRKISIARKGMKFSDSHRRAMSEAKVRFLSSGGFHGKQSEYVSVKTGEKNWAHSGFEVELMKKMDASDDVVSWTKNHSIKIPYEWNGQRIYVPDFLVEMQGGLMIVLEAKGYEFEPQRCAAKSAAAKKYCDEMGWTYHTVYQSQQREKEGK